MPRLTFAKLPLHARQIDARPAVCPMDHPPDAFGDLRRTALRAEQGPVRVLLLQLPPTFHLAGRDGLTDRDLITQVEPFSRVPYARDAPLPADLVGPDAGAGHHFGE